MNIFRNIPLFLVAIAALLSLGCSNTASAEPTSTASIPTNYQAYGDSTFSIHMPGTWSPDEAFKMLLIEDTELALRGTNNPDARLHETDSLLFYGSLRDELLGPNVPNVFVIATENPSDSTTESFSNLARHDTSDTVPSGVLGDEIITIGTGAGSAQIWSIRFDGSDLIPNSVETMGFIVLSGASTKQTSAGNVINWSVVCGFVVEESAKHERDCQKVVNSFRTTR